jgi:hypothetical protein
MSMTAKIEKGEYPFKIPPVNKLVDNLFYLCSNAQRALFVCQGEHSL